MPEWTIVSQPAWMSSTTTSAPADSYDMSVGQVSQLVEASIREQLRERARRQALYLVVCERAERLLASLLSDDDFRRYLMYTPIHIRGSAGGEYMVWRGCSSNVLNAKGQTLCAHPSLNRGTDGLPLPVATVMAAQILMLWTDEPRFLAIANVV